MKPKLVVVGGWRENRSSFEYRCRFAVINTLNNMLSKNWILSARCDFDQFFGRGRPDVVVHIEHKGHATSTMIIECKSCLNDLKSGVGLNLVGNINYIIYPEKSNLTKRKINKYLAETNREGIGILMLDEENKIKQLQYSWLKEDGLPRWLQALGIGTSFGDY